jgi:hypothetical protein
MNELSAELVREMENEKRRKKIENAINDIFNELNCMGRERDIGETIVNAIRRQHRTLQQDFFGHCVKPIILDFAKRYEEHNFDLRNEASCGVASKLKPYIEKEHFPFI